MPVIQYQHMIKYQIGIFLIDNLSLIYVGNMSLLLFIRIMRASLFVIVICYPVYVNSILIYRRLHWSTRFPQIFYTGYRYGY